jgi:hypothetical protein
MRTLTPGFQRGTTIFGIFSLRSKKENRCAQITLLLFAIIKSADKDLLFDPY